MSRTLLHSRYRALALLLAALVGAATLTRLVLLGLLAATAGEPPAGAAVRALAAGAAADLLAALWLAAPVLLWLTASRDRRWSAATHPRRRAALLAMAVAVPLALAAFTAVAEVLFYDEFTSRFNFVAVDYLIYPTEVMTNLGESYPVPAILGAVAAVGALAWVAVWRATRPVIVASVPARRRLAVAAAYAAVLAVLALALPVELARVSDDRALNEVAASGYVSFWRAVRGQDAPYQGLYATRPDAEVFGALRRALAEPASAGSAFAPASTVRHVRALRPERRLNVVLVLEESFGSEFVGTLHPEGPSVTPAFDTLAAEGTLLTRAYSTGNRTIRALEATTTSLPPLPGISVVRRDASAGLFTLPALLRARGYGTEFVYGGRALFDNMGAYMRANGMQRVVEQRDYPNGLFRTAWGVADEAIFDMALRQADSLHATGRPFFLQVLTVSNHKPYTYPTGRIAADPAKRWRVNAVAYADWALGRFARQARGHPWFGNTLFVFMGDHGARVYGASEIPLPSYEVPVLFWAPDIVPAGRQVNTLASSLDVPPTILSLLGVSYDSPFFGRDVLAAGADDGRALMTHNSEVALMRGGDVAVLGLHESARLYRWDDGRHALVPVAAPDARGRALLEEAIAYYDGADRLYRTGAYAFDAVVSRASMLAVASAGGAGSSTTNAAPRLPVQTSATNARPPWTSAIQRAIGRPSPALAGSPTPVRRAVPRSRAAAPSGDR